MGYVVHIAGGSVAWKSKLMETLALSSCEIEFMALCEACRELMWICRCPDEIGVPYEVPEIYCDSSLMNWAEDSITYNEKKKGSYVHDSHHSQCCRYYQACWKTYHGMFRTKGSWPRTSGSWNS